jgi:hypothetical protein
VSFPTAARPKASTDQLLEKSDGLVKTNLELASASRHLLENSRNLIQASRGLIQLMLERARGHVMEAHRGGGNRDHSS